METDSHAMVRDTVEVVNTTRQGPKPQTNDSMEITEPNSNYSPNKRKHNEGEDEEEHKRAGCSCEDSCLEHSCSCFVQGQFCDPSFCNCFGLTNPSAEAALVSASSETAHNKRCKNNDDEENVELRKQRLMIIMQEHPEMFWPTNGQSLTVATPRTDPRSSHNLECISTVAEESKRAAVVNVHTKFWSTLQGILQERLVPSEDDMDIDEMANSTSSREPLNLFRIRSYLEKLLQQHEGPNDGHSPETTEARNRIQETMRDLLQVIKVMEDCTDKENGTRTSTASNAASFAASVVHESNPSVSAEEDKEHALLCSEEFPEEIDKSTNGNSSYDEKLATALVTFANTGNSNDPLVHNLICEETGFFEGDDSLVYEKNAEDSGSDLDTTKRVAMIQETTRLIRAKTLELARQRLKRLRNGA